VHIYTTLFDTLDDGQPGGRLTEETATVVHGPHPGFAADWRSAASPPS
jgi:hypothetical protein